MGEALKELLPILLAIIAIAAVIIVPIWLTRKAPKETDPPEVVEQLLQNPLVRRTILRLELGGILAGVVALLFATWGLYQANYQSRLAESALRDQRISGAWQILSQSGPSASGKAYALEVLTNDTDAKLIGLNLGCDPSNIVPSRHGLPWQECKNPQVLKGMVLARSNGDEILIDRSNFDYTEIEDVALENAYISYSSFTQAQLQEVVLRNINLWEFAINKSYLDGVIFDYAGIVSANFSDSTIRAHITRSSIFYSDFSRMRSSEIVFKDVQFHSANLSGTDLLQAFRLEGENFFGNSHVFPRIKQVDGAYSGAPAFIISNATLCAQASEGKPDCWAGVNQEFLNIAYYWVGEPPTGLDLLDQSLLIRPPCARPPQPVGERADTIFRYADEVCKALPLTSVSDLIASGVLTQQ